MYDLFFKKKHYDNLSDLYILLNHYVDTREFNAFTSITSTIWLYSI